MCICVLDNFWQGEFHNGYNFRKTVWTAVKLGNLKHPNLLIIMR